MLKRNVVSILGLVILFSSSSQAQPIGNPILHGGQREFTVSLSGGYVMKNIEELSTTSRRYLLKGTFGLTHWLDIFGRVGAANLEIKIPEEDLSDLKTSYKSAYGGGINLRLLRFAKGKLSFFAAGQAFRFLSQGSLIGELTVEKENWRREIELSYDWREYEGALGAVCDLKKFDIYGGVQATWLNRLETKREYPYSPGGDPFVTKGEYLSGAMRGFFFGCDLSLPSRFKISCELKGRNRSDGFFSIGISQRGRP
jgi:hypothetical protein